MREPETGGAETRKRHGRQRRETRKPTDLRAKSVDGSAAGPDDIAARESCSKRHVMMMISLSFLAPDLVRAALEGRLPRGIGVTRLTDAPIEWSRQWHMLGL